MECTGLQWLCWCRDSVRPNSRSVSPGGISQEEYSHVSLHASPAKMLNTALGFEGQAFSIAEGSSCFQPVVSTAGQMPRYVSPVPFMMPQQLSNILHSVTPTSLPHFAQSTPLASSLSSDALLQLEMEKKKAQR